LRAQLPRIEHVISDVGLRTPNLDMDGDVPELSWFNRSRDVLLAISISQDERLWVHINRGGQCQNVKDPDNALLGRLLGELRA
jgi:hypothetical protein